MKENYEPKQYELLCNECPIQGGCDENSVWCALSWLKGGNDAQKELMQLGTSEDPELRARQYRDEHREDKRRRDRERYRRQIGGKYTYKVKERTTQG